MGFLEPFDRTIGTMPRVEMPRYDPEPMRMVRKGVITIGDA